MKTWGLLFYALGGQKGRNGEDWESVGRYYSSSQFSPPEIIFLWSTNWSEQVSQASSCNQGSVSRKVSSLKVPSKHVQNNRFFFHLTKSRGLPPSIPLHENSSPRGPCWLSNRFWALHGQKWQINDLIKTSREKWGTFPHWKSGSYLDNQIFINVTEIYDLLLSLSFSYALTLSGFW